MKLYHRTCAHRIDEIRADGFLKPHTQPLLGVRLLWLTHVPWADRAALALSSDTLNCDRMQYLLEIPEPREVVPWTLLRPELNPAAVRQLEAARGARPAFWWVTATTQEIAV